MSGAYKYRPQNTQNTIGPALTKEQIDLRRRNHSKAIELYGPEECVLDLADECNYLATIDARDAEIAEVRAEVREWLYWYEGFKAACEVRDTESADLKKRLTERDAKVRDMALEEAAKKADEHCLSSLGSVIAAQIRTLK